MRRFLFGLMALLPSLSVQAELVRFEITERVPFADGHSFGEVGPYERIVGRAYFALDPTLRQNEAVVDLKLAPRNAAGKVEFWSDVFILAPADPTKGNGALLYDVNNRGNKLALGMFNYGGNNNPTTKEHAGDGFLMRHGFTVVWSGWDGELLPGGDRMRLTAPPVRSGESPITGTVRCEFLGSKGMTRSVVNWANHGSYRPTKETLEEAPHPHPLTAKPGGGDKAMTLTVRERPAAARVVIPSDQWTVHVTDVSSDSPTQLPNVEVEMPGGMKPGYIYELIYEASNPLVMGVCFTSVRDLIAAIKHGSGEANPLTKGGQPVIQRAHGFGVSQSGRFLREFLHAGFNEDELGRKVFDGLIPHVAGGGLGSFNHRFAQPTRHSNQHDHHDYPPDRFPFAYEVQLDPLSGREDGILKRSLATKTAPRVMHTQSAAEYWTRSGSLVHTDPLGTRDSLTPLAPALRGERPEVRGSSHVPSPPASGERARVTGLNGDDGPSNTNDSTLPPSPRRGGPGRGADERTTPIGQSSPLPNPPHSGEGTKPKQTAEEKKPHPNPLPSKARGEGTEQEEPLTLALSPQSRGEGTGDTSAQLAHVRFYTFGGTQHGPSGFPPSAGNGQNLTNPGDYKPFLRSLLLAIDQWTKDGTEPPASVVPSIAEGTLVDWRHAGTGFPNIPGVTYPETIQQPSLLDFGPRWETERIIDFQPPRLRGDYRVLVPRCGADGNELGCLLPVEVAVPVATYTGWNLRKADVGAEGQLVSLTGSYIPFPVTKGDREKTGDPRPSVRERYDSLDEYTRQLTAAADMLKASGYLLEEDHVRLVKLHRERVAKLFEQTSSR